MINQLEIAFFSNREFCGKLVWPLYEEVSRKGIDQLAKYLIAIGCNVFDADGWRVEFGPHNATNVLMAKNAGPRK